MAKSKEGEDVEGEEGGNGVQLNLSSGAAMVVSFAFFELKEIIEAACLLVEYKHPLK